MNESLATNKIWHTLSMDSINPDWSYQTLVYNAQWKTSRVFGIEVETESIHGTFIGKVSNFSKDEDGSLRHIGLEFKTMSPVPASVLKEETATLLTRLKEQQFFFSHRSSIHIHANMLDKTLKDITEIIKCYIFLEPLCVKFIGRARQKSNFCIPLYSFLHQINLNPSRWPTLTGVPSGIHYLQQIFQKYGALSAFRLNDLGTLEWRAMEGTFNIEKIVKWIDLINYIVVSHTGCEDYQELNTQAQYILGISYTPVQLDEQIITMEGLS